MPTAKTIAFLKFQPYGSEGPEEFQAHRYEVRQPPPWLYPADAIITLYFNSRRCVSALDHLTDHDPSVQCQVLIVKNSNGVCEDSFTGHVLDAEGLRVMAICEADRVPAVPAAKEEEEDEESDRFQDIDWEV